MTERLTPPPDDPPKVLEDKYQVLARLGGGGMGNVYLVRHIHLEEKRVVKTLRSDRTTDPDAQKRFLREARFASLIKHPNVAMLHDYSRLANGDFYMVWEHIEGEDVGSRIERAGPFPVPEALELGRQALQGLGAIHAAGMVHRDVSPDNLMITRDRAGRPRLKIIDLGLAKALEPDSDYEVTQDGMFMGKLLYCAPEQAGLVKGDTVDHRTDLYSLALVLYEMLTGLPPFDHETPQGAIFKRVSEDPLPLIGRNPQVTIPPALEPVIRKALARDPDERYPDAAAFEQALGGIAAGLEQGVTQEIEPYVPEAAEGAAPADRPLPEPPAPAPARPAAEPSAVRELSAAERQDLLARIERAAERVKESTRTVDQVDAFLAGGRLDEARALVERLAESDPRARALPGLRRRLAEAEERLAERQEERERRRREEIDAELAAAERDLGAGRAGEAEAALERARALGADPERLAPLAERVERLTAAVERGARVREAEELVERYLQKKQVQLARLAFDSLLELDPNHPRQGDFESWIGLVAEEAETDDRAAALLADGRRAVAAGDLRAARRQAAALAKVDTEAAATLEGEIDAAEADARQSASYEEHRERLAELLDAGRFDEAQREIDELAEAGAARVTLDLYRASLEEARQRALEDAEAEAFLEVYRERLGRGDFQGAREVTGELQRAAPASPRPAAMFAEIAEAERDAERRRAVEEGSARLEAFLDSGDRASAELALRVLLQLAPDHKKRRQYEKRLARL